MHELPLLFKQLVTSNVHINQMSAEITILSSGDFGVVESCNSNNLIVICMSECKLVVGNRSGFVLLRIIQTDFSNRIN